MSKSSQDEGAAESAAQAPGGTPKKTPGDIYENRGGSKKIIRVFTVMAYMFSVSFVGILLSAYYVFLWQPPNPRLLHKAHLRADPQFEFLVDTQPASLSLEANRTRDTNNKTITPDEDLQDHQEVIHKVMTFAQASLKADTRKFSVYPSSSIDRKHVNLNSSEDRSHRVKQDSEMPRRSSRAKNLTASKYESRVSLRNILQRSTLTTQNTNETNESFSTSAFVIRKNESSLPVNFLNDSHDIGRINEVEVNSARSNEFIRQTLKNPSSWNSTFDHLEESEENFNETEVKFTNDHQVNLPNPAHSEENKIIEHPDLSPIKSKILTEPTIYKNLIEESTTDSYTENWNVSTYSIETLINRIKTTESSRMDDLMMSSTEPTQSVVPLQNELKIPGHPEDIILTETTSEATNTFEAASMEFEDSMENLQTIDKNR